MCRLSAQIDLNTNFDILSNQPIDSRNVLDNLSDTSGLTWNYKGLLTYAKDVNQYWVYNGSFWEQLTADNLATANITQTAEPRTYNGNANNLTFSNVTDFEISATDDVNILAVDSIFSQSPKQIFKNNTQDILQIDGDGAKVLNAATDNTSTVLIGKGSLGELVEIDDLANFNGIGIESMTTAQRVAISAPATGLQVYDTDTNSFWFYNGTAWTEKGTTIWKKANNTSPDATTDDVYREGKVSIGNTFVDDGLLNFDLTNGDTTGIHFSTGAINVEHNIIETSNGNGNFGIGLRFRRDENTLYLSPKLPNITYGNAKSNTFVIMGTNAIAKELVNPFASVIIGYNAVSKAVNSNSITSVGYQSLFNLTDGVNLTTLGTDAAFNFDTVSNATVLGRHLFFKNGVLLNGSYITSIGGDSFDNTTSAFNLEGFGYLSGVNAVTAKHSGLYGNEILRYRASINQTYLKGYQAGYTPNVAAADVTGATGMGYRTLYNSDNINNVVSMGSLSGYFSSYDEAHDRASDVLVGWGAGWNSYGGNNTFIGNRAGWVNTSTPTNVTGAVAIGSSAGYLNIASNKLFIDNSGTATPLIGGDFSTNVAEIGGTLEVMTMATDNANTNVVVRNATTGALELNTTATQNLATSNLTQTDAVRDYTATGKTLNFATLGFTVTATDDLQLTATDEAIHTANDHRFLTNNQKLNIDNDGVKISNTTVDNTATTLYGKDPTTSEIIEVTDLTGFTGATPSGISWTSGTGSPESVVTANVGSLYTRTDGGTGTTLYVKETGTGNTGWVGK